MTTDERLEAVQRSSQFRRFNHEDGAEIMRLAADLQRERDAVQARVAVLEAMKSSISVSLSYHWNELPTVYRLNTSAVIVGETPPEPGEIWSEKGEVK